MIDLPPEILDEIFELCVWKEIPLQKRFRDTPIQHPPHQWVDFLESNTRRRFDHDQACLLRTVSRSFYRAASRALFRYKWFSVDTSKRRSLFAPPPSASLDRALSPCNDTTTTTTTSPALPQLHPSAVEIRKLSISIQSNTSHSASSNLQALFSALPPHLIALEVAFPPGWVEQVPASTNLHGAAAAAAVVLLRRRRPRATEYDLDALDELMAASLQRGVQTAAFEGVRDLRLLLPGTVHFGAVATSLSDKACANLTRLMLAVGDRTGPGGDRMYLVDSRPEGDTGDEAHPRSNLQVRYPNAEHVGEMVRLVERCENLEELGLMGTHFLDLDALGRSWRPRNKGLRLLFLSRVRCSAWTLEKLMAPKEGVGLQSVVTRVRLDQVELKNESTWAEVLGFMREKCPSLAYFCPVNLGYVPRHPLREWVGRPTLHGADMWTADRRGDREALRMLVQKLVDKAGGETNYPSGSFEQTCMLEGRAMRPDSPFSDLFWANN